MIPNEALDLKITKSSFLRFLECPREFWLAHFHPEEMASTIDASARVRIKQGYEVQKLVKNLILKSKDMPPQPGLFGDLDFRYESTVKAGPLSAKIDILDGDNLIEVKSSKHIPKEDSRKKAKRERNLWDVAYQVYVARLAGETVEQATLATLDRDYVRGAELDPEGLIHFEDVTLEVEALLPSIEKLVSEALKTLESGPSDDFDDLCSLKLRCPYFTFTQPDLPEYTIYDIPNLRGSRLNRVIATGALDLAELPLHSGLTEKQQLWVDDILDPPDMTIINKNGLVELLDGLEYPLYFFDYETFNPAIPLFEGMGAYDMLTFQYSLHVQEEKGGPLTHHHFLSNGTGEFQKELLEKLSGRFL